MGKGQLRALPGGPRNEKSGRPPSEGGKGEKSSKFPRKGKSKGRNFNTVNILLPWKPTEDSLSGTHLREGK